MARKLVVEIVGDASSLERTFKQVGVAGRGFATNVGLSLGTIVKSAVVFDVVNKAIQGLSDTVHLGIEEFKDNAQVAAQTAAAIKSTGGTAGVTAKQIDALGQSLSNLSGVDDEIIRAGENVLLSFRNIRDQAGKGNDVFTRATKAALDFAVRTGRTVPQAAQLLGRALEDPARKAGSLARAGIVLSASQLKLLKHLEDTGHALDAQKVLLAELAKRFGGAAAAAGKTLPGELAVLRERFKDLAGKGIGLMVPSLSRAVAGLTGFVRKLSEAQGAGAKFRVVGAALSDLDKQMSEFGARVFQSAKRAFDRIDWKAVFETVRNAIVTEFARIRQELGPALALFQDVARTAGQALLTGFQRIDWNAVGVAVLNGFGQAGRLASRGILVALNLITQAVQHVDFQKVGKVLVDGFAAAVIAVGNFLIHVNWGAIIGATVRLAVAAVRGTISLLVGAGKELGRAILEGLSAGLDALGKAVELKALQIVRKLLSIFDVTIPGIHRHLIPGLHSLIKDIQAQIDSLKDKTVTITVKTKTEIVTTGAVRGTPAEAAAAAAAKPAAAPRPKQPATVLNTKPLDTSFGLATKAAADVKSAADKAAAALQAMLDKLNLAVNKATLTKTLTDDLKANANLIAALKQQIKLHKDNLDLQNQLVSAEQARLSLIQQQNDAELAARNARQFRSLGLGPTGQALIPLKAGLARQLRQVTDQIQGSFLDTAKNQRILKAIRALVLNPFTKVSADVRSTIKQMLDDIQQQLKDSGAKVQTKTQSLDTSRLVKGLGLDRETANALRARLSRFNTAGLALASPPAALATSTAVASDVNVTLQLDGRTVAHVNRKHDQRFRRQNPRGRRGRR